MREFWDNIYRFKCPNCDSLYSYAEIPNKFEDEEDGVVWMVGICPNCKKEYIILL